MTELFLIAHKVRGEPAFDIATRMEVELPTGEFEEWWIIPTSGHRAYPYWEAPICPADDLRTMFINDLRGHVAIDFDLPPMPSDLPDHYTTTAVKGEGKITDLFQKLFKTKSEPINRRL